MGPKPVPAKAPPAPAAKSRGIFGGLFGGGAKQAPAPVSKSVVVKKAVPVAVKKAPVMKANPVKAPPVRTAPASVRAAPVIQPPAPRPPAVDPNASPRQRAPGRAPCASAAELRKEMEAGDDVEGELEEDAVLARRDHIVQAMASPHFMPFTDVRKPLSRLHPSVIPRKRGGEPIDATRDTVEVPVLADEVMEDPSAVGHLHGIDKVIQSRKFIQAMRESLKHPIKSPKGPLPRISENGRLVADGQAISPMQENITSVSFLPAPFAVCQVCGLYEHSCICRAVPTTKRVVPRRALSPVESSRSDDSEDSDNSDGEGPIGSISVSSAPRVGASLRSEDGYSEAN